MPERNVCTEVVGGDHHFDPRGEPRHAVLLGTGQGQDDDAWGDHLGELGKCAGLTKATTAAKACDTVRLGYPFPSSLPMWRRSIFKRLETITLRT